MDFEQTRLEYHIDYINKKVHLLDLSQAALGQIVNNISPDYQKRLMEAQGLMQDIIDFDWIVYCIDGLICSYQNYNFKVQNPKLPYLHIPYKKICEGRRSRNLL